MRDELGTHYTDQEFVSLYPRRGQPTEAPWRLALIAVMRFVELVIQRRLSVAAGNSASALIGARGTRVAPYRR